MICRFWNLANYVNYKEGIKINNAEKFEKMTLLYQNFSIKQEVKFS
jgi:hypothetical protein